MGSAVIEERDESEELDLPLDPRTLYLRLRRRWKAMALSALVAACCGLGLAFLFGSRVFQAEAVLHYRPSEVEKKPPNLLTLLNIVKLQENLEAVRDRLDLSTSLTTLSGAYKVDVRRDTELLVIQASAESPEKAAELAKTLRDVFLESQERRRRTKLEGVRNSLEARLAEVSAELKSADKALQEFTVTNQIVDLDKEAQWYLEELTSLQIMLEEAQVQRTSVRQKAQNVDRIVADLKAKVAREKAESQTEFDSLGDINIRVQRLRAAIHDDKTQRAGEALLEQKRLELERADELRSKGLISDADYEKKLAAYNSQKALTVDTEQVSDWKAKVEELNQKAIPSGQNQQAQSGPILQEMMLKSFDIQLELVTQDKRVARVEEAVKKSRRRLDALPQLQRTFAALSREVKSIETQKTDLENRLGDTRRLLSTRLLDFVVASEPKLRPDPVSSNRRLVALAGTVIVFGLALLTLLGREILDPRCLSGPELAARSGRTVFGVLPEGTPSELCRSGHLLARSLPQRGRLVVAAADGRVELEQACRRIGRALTYQGVPTVLLGVEGEGSALSDHLHQGVQAPEPVVEPATGLASVPVGPVALPPSIFRTESFQNYLQWLESRYQMILILAPALDNSVTAEILAEQADGVVVVASTSTPLGSLKKAAARVEGPLLGLTLTGVAPPFLDLS